MRAAPGRPEAEDPGPNAGAPVPPAGPVAAAASTTIVVGTAVGAAVTHTLQLMSEAGAGAALRLPVGAFPGWVIGATLDTGLQGTVSLEHPSHPTALDLSRMPTQGRRH